MVNVKVMGKPGRPSVEIFRDGTDMIIQSRFALRDLVPKRNRKTMVVVGGEEFYVADTKASGNLDYFLYKLKPWPSGREIAGRRLFYESAADLATEATSRLKERRTTLVHLLYLVIFPLVGFFPLSWKESLEQRFGWSIHSHTFFTICAEIAIVLAAATMLSISNVAAAMLAVMYGGKASESALLVAPNLLLAVIGIFTIDLFFRYHNYSEGRYLGFYEWLFRHRKR